MSDTSSATTYLRTSIVLAKNIVDVQLPSESAVEDVVYELIRYLNSALAEQGHDTSWLLDADAVWTLERFGRRQLDNEQSLSEQGVLDGERLWLTKNAKNETYPALIDDIAESVAKYQDQFPEWKYGTDAVKFSAILLGVIGVVGAFLATFVACWGLPTDNGLRYPLVAIIGGIALLTSVVSVPLIRGESKLLGTSMLTVGYASVGCAAFMSIPREPGLWHLATVGAALLVYAAVMMPLTPGPVRLHSGVLSVATVVTIVSLINYFWTASPSVIAIEMATLSYVIILSASKMSMLAGKVETPYVPAPGEELTKDEASIGDVNRSASSSDVIESVINQKEQNYAAHQYLMGILLGNLSVIVGASAFAGAHAEDRPITVFFLTINEKWLLCMFTLSIAITMLNRARNHIDKDVHGSLLTASLVIPFAYLSGLAFSDVTSNAPQIIAVVALVTLASLVGGLWSLGQRSIKSPTVRGYLEIVETALYATPVLWLGWLLDIYMKVRNR